MPGDWQERSHSDELWQLRTAASNQPYAVCAACQRKSQIQLPKSKSSTLVGTKLTGGRHPIEVQLRTAAALRQAPLCCHQQPRRDQRHEHCSHCTVKILVHSIVAMEALEASGTLSSGHLATSMAAEIDPDLISKIRARHATRNRRARGYNVQAILWSRRRRSKFATVTCSLEKYDATTPPPCTCPACPTA